MREAAADLGSLRGGPEVGTATVVFLVVVTLAMLADGFDLSAIGFIAPELVKKWGVAPAQLAPMFSAGILGLLFGAPLLGFLGDRFGRKKALLAGLCAVGLITLATMAANTLPQFIALRFLTGIGLGGVIPNVIALTAEAAPKRLRGMFIVIVNFGVPAGVAVPGLASAALMPRYGWPVLLLIGGLLPLLAATLIGVLIPESTSYRAQRDARGKAVEEDTRGVMPSQDAVGRPGLGLFAGSLAGITPMLWLALAANQMANFFSLSWLPTLLRASGSSVAKAGINASLFSIGGLVGGLCLTFIVDRFGVIPMVVLFLMGVPLMAAIGAPDLPPLAFGAIIAGAGFCVIGINFSMSATLGMVYPTSVRSLGTGWAQAFGRVGALAAPFIGGALLGLHLSMQDLLLAPAGALAIGAVAAGVLAVLCVRRFGGCQLDEQPRERAHEMQAATGSQLDAAVP